MRRLRVLGIALLMGALLLPASCEKPLENEELIAIDGKSKKKGNKKKDKVNKKKLKAAINHLLAYKGNLRAFMTGRFLTNPNSPSFVLRKKAYLKKALKDKKLRKAIKAYQKAVTKATRGVEDRDFNLQPQDGSVRGIIQSGLFTSLITDGMGSGYNLGNMLDQHGGDWGNPQPFGGELALVHKMIDDIKALGFKSLRIPVTWYENTGGAPNYAINANYMRAVVDLVNYAVRKGFKVIINTHHEEYLSGDRFFDTKRNNDQIFHTWRQIAFAFRDVSPNSLIFEVLNEPRPNNSFDRNTPDVQTVVNWYNQKALDAIQSTSSGSDANAIRWVMFPTAWAAPSMRYISEFVTPLKFFRGGTAKPYFRSLASIHTYEPFNFTFKAGGSKSTWDVPGSSDKAKLKAHLDGVKRAFGTKVRAVVFGEFGAEDKNNPRERSGYYYDYNQVSGCSPAFIWDNGNLTRNSENFGLYDRDKSQWVFENIAYSGKNGSLEVNCR